jgi:hypothetical protein
MQILERNTEESERMREELLEYAVAQKFQFTYEDAEVHMRVTCGFSEGCSRNSIWRYITNPANGWKIVSSGTRPLLSKKHMKGRVAYARARLLEGDKRWFDHVDLDEKWFYAWTYGKCKIPPGYDRPKKALQHKSHIKKVMFLAATALPRPEHDFDGKVGFWRVSEKYTAKNKSKNYARGQVYDKDTTMDAALYLKMMKEKVFPAIRRKMPWAKTVRAQHDKATPHVGQDNLNQLNIAGAKTSKRADGTRTAKITVFNQEAQSPCTNINDLAIFPSMSRRFNKKQKHENVHDKEQLAKNAMKTWREFPPDVLTKAWATKTAVLVCIDEAKGGNDFKLPHSKDMEQTGRSCLRGGER